MDLDGTEAGLQAAVASIGPISVAFLVTNNFYSYSSGTYNMYINRKYNLDQICVIAFKIA